MTETADHVRYKDFVTTANRKQAENVHIVPVLLSEYISCHSSSSEQNTKAKTGET
jgi:hypothetical protein